MKKMFVLSDFLLEIYNIFNFHQMKVYMAFCINFLSKSEPESEIHGPFTAMLAPLKINFLAVLF